MRLQNTQAHKQEISYAQAHKQETSNAQAQLQETSNAQAHKQETYNQTDLHRKLFEFEHLIYNGVHNTNQLLTLKTLETIEFLKYGLC